MRLRGPGPRLVITALLAVTAAAWLMPVTGCGVGPEATPEEIIEKAVTAQEKLKSVHMELESEMDVDLPGGNRSSAIFYEGVFEKPDRWRLTVRSVTGRSELVIIGDMVYVKTAGSETWDQKIVGEHTSGSPPDDVVGSQYMDSATGVRMIDRKDGKYHLGFDLDMERYAREFNVPGVDPSELEGKTAKMEVWILEDSMYIQKATMEFSGNVGTDSGKVKMSMETEFSEFNRPVTIEPPI